MVSGIGNINRLSLYGQRQLNKSTAEAGGAMRRLSSGLRINDASDDAAGLAVSSKLLSDKKIFTKGIDNLNQGISLVNIADSALEQLGAISGRIQELAAQSANGVLSDSQRSALQSEATSLQYEWNRIIDTTTFNGKQILKASGSNTNLQGGYGANGNLSVQVGSSALVGAIDDRTEAIAIESSSSSGVLGNGISGYENISADGRYVAFQSTSSNLVSGDTNGLLDVFVKDTLLGTITRVSTSTSGTEGNGNALLPSISADGRYVSFHSDSTNLVSGDTNGAQDIFVRDLQLGTLTRVSTDSSGAQSNGSSYYSSLSADGRYVAFESLATNLVSGDTNGVSDIFVKDLQLGTITRVSLNNAGTQGDAASIRASISADGHYVAFNSAATNLVSGDSNAKLDVFVRDLIAGTTTRVSTDTTGTQGNDDSQIATISADGKFVSFSSAATNLVNGDSNASIDIFVKELATGIMSRVSTDSAGNQGSGVSSAQSISADGRYVSFATTSALSSDDTNGLYDAYVKDRATGSVVRISTSDTGAQGSAGLVDWTRISADGQYAAFHSTFTNLVSGDTNGTTDIFLRKLSTAGIQQLAGMVVSDKASAKITLDLATRYGETISQYRAALGTSINRLETFSSSLESTTDNYDAAASRITDVDVAEETSRLVSSRIKQQAATAMFAQSKQQHVRVLKLINAD